MAGLFGVLIGVPALRLTGDYLAILTLGFGEIIRITLNNIDDVLATACSTAPRASRTSPSTPTSPMSSSVWSLPASSSMP